MGLRRKIRKLPTTIHSVGKSLKKSHFRNSAQGSAQGDFQTVCQCYLLLFCFQELSWGSCKCRDSGCLSTYHVHLQDGALQKNPPRKVWILIQKSSPPLIIFFGVGPILCMQGSTRQVFSLKCSAWPYPSQCDICGLSILTPQLCSMHLEFFLQYCFIDFDIKLILSSI